MAIRGRVREITQRLRGEGSTTPVLSNIAIPAEVLFEQAFTLPSLPSLPSVPGLTEILKSLPAFAHGKASGPVAGQWYRVRYPTAIKNATPVAIGLARIGQITNRAISVSSILHLTVPAFPNIPRITRDDFNSDAYCTLVAQAARDRVNTLAPPWPLDLVWNFVCGNLIYYGFYAAWYTSGWILNVLWDSFIQPQIDKVQDTVLKIAQDIRDTLWGQVDKVQDALGGQISAVQDAVNLRLNDLYNMWGIPSGMIATPLHIRNPTTTGFEFQSFGNTQCTWIAIGERQ